MPVLLLGPKPAPRSPREPRHLRSGPSYCARDPAPAQVHFTGTVTGEESDPLAVRRHFSLPLIVLPRDEVRLTEVALPLLETACQSPDPSAAIDAAKTLAHIRDPAMTSLLAKMLDCGLVGGVEAVAALARMGTVEATAALIDAAHGDDEEIAELAQRPLAAQ